MLPRHLLRRGQTPQSFRLSTIRAAYAKAAEDPNFTATDDCTVVLRYLPDVPIAVVAGHERNMKVTEPIDVYIADKLFQLTSADQPAAAAPTRSTGPGSTGKTMVVFGGSYGIGGDIADLAAALRRHGARPSPAPTTGTHVERRDRHRRGRPARCWPRPGGSTSWSTPPACSPAASWPRRPRRPSTPRPT